MCTRRHKPGSYTVMHHNKYCILFLSVKDGSPALNTYPCFESNPVSPVKTYKAQALSTLGGLHQGLEQGLDVFLGVLTRNRYPQSACALLYSWRADGRYPETLLKEGHGQGHRLLSITYYNGEYRRLNLWHL